MALVIALMIYFNLQKEGIEWQAYSSEKLEMAINEGRPVMIDFYADWCIPCRELDRITFTDEEVIEATRDMVRLKVDLTNFDSPDSEILRQQYEIAGVPTIVFLDPQGSEVRNARVVGFLRPADFMRRVNLTKEVSLSLN